MDLAQVAHEGEPVQADVLTSADPDPEGDDDPAATSVLAGASQVVGADGTAHEAGHRPAPVEEAGRVTRAREVVEGDVMPVEPRSEVPVGANRAPTRPALWACAGCTSRLGRAHEPAAGATAPALKTREEDPTTRYVAVAVGPCSSRQESVSARVLREPSARWGRRSA